MLQIVNAAELKARGATFQATSQAMIYERGMIRDAQNNILAKSVGAKDIFAEPKKIAKYLEKDEIELTAQDIADKMAEILGKDSPDILALITKDLSWVSIERQVDLEKATKLAELGIPGIGFTDTYKRVYPMGNLAASVLGIVNMGGNGVEGVEYFYNSELMGEKILKSMEGMDKQAVDVNAKNIKSGYNLNLTLDSTIQYMVEQELDQIMDQTKAARAVILAMDPMTGKILGMGSRPTFDPNNYGVTKAVDRKNLAISMIYEPGSTFKIITGAAALEESVITPDQVFNDPGYIIVGSRRITNWDSDRKANGNITFTDGMLRSSNVVLAKVIERLGVETFYTYLKSFGFGAKTKIDIAGEEQGLLIERKQVKDLELATMSFGQANLVTPVQLLSGICAVANGGNLMQPYILDNITDQNGEIIYQNKPQITRKVISQATSTAMVDILVDVVDSPRGTGGRAKIPGIKVAGKTGTAQKVDPETGRYSEKDYIVSFTAFAPADKPRIAVLVVIDSPRGDVIQGGTLAGPRAKKVIESTLQYYGIPVAASTQSDLTDLTRITPAGGADGSTSGNIQSPNPDQPPLQPGKGEVAVPDLTGLSIRQAGDKLGKLDLRYKFVGSGYAQQQFPEAGKIVNKGDLIEVVFSMEQKAAP